MRITWIGHDEMGIAQVAHSYGAKDRNAHVLNLLVSFILVHMTPLPPNSTVISQAQHWTAKSQPCKQKQLSPPMPLALHMAILVHVNTTWFCRRFGSLKWMRERERERERVRTGPFGRETGHSWEIEKQKYKHMFYKCVGRLSARVLITCQSLVDFSGN